MMVIDSHLMKSLTKAFRVNIVFLVSSIPQSGYGHSNNPKFSNSNSQIPTLDFIQNVIALNFWVFVKSKLEIQ